MITFFFAAIAFFTGILVGSIASKEELNETRLDNARLKQTLAERYELSKHAKEVFEKREAALEAENAFLTRELVMQRAKYAKPVKKPKA